MMSATELRAFVISCDFPGCYEELYGYAGDSIGDVMDGTTWGREDGLYFCYDHFDTENVEATKAALAKKEPTP